EENLHQLIPVPTNAREYGFELQFNARCSGAQIKCAKLHRIVDHRVDVKERTFGGHLAGETKEIADQSLCAARLISDFRGGCASLLRDCRVIGKQFGKA